MEATFVLAHFRLFASPACLSIESPSMECGNFHKTAYIRPTANDIAILIRPVISPFYDVQVGLLLIYTKPFFSVNKKKINKNKNN